MPTVLAPRVRGRALTEEKLAEVRGWIEAAGFPMRDGSSPPMPT